MFDYGIKAENRFCWDLITYSRKQVLLGFDHGDKAENRFCLIEWLKHVKKRVLPKCNLGNASDSTSNRLNNKLTNAAGFSTTNKQTNTRMSV